MAAASRASAADGAVLLRRTVVLCELFLLQLPHEALPSDVAHRDEQEDEMKGPQHGAEDDAGDL